MNTHQPKKLFDFLDKLMCREPSGARPSGNMTCLCNAHWGSSENAACCISNRWKSESSGLKNAVPERWATAFYKNCVWWPSVLAPCILFVTRVRRKAGRLLLFEISGEVFASYTTSPADQRESRSPGAYCEGNRFVPLYPGSALRLVGDVDRRRRCGRLFEFLNTRLHSGKPPSDSSS